MAFDQSHLAAMVHADGQTWWQYKSTDPANTITTSGYFNNAAAMLKVGDLVFVLSGTGNNTGSFHVVRANDGTTVDLNNGLFIPVANRG